MKKKYILGLFIILVVLFVVSWFFIGNSFLNSTFKKEPELTVLELLDKKIKSKEWKSFYPIIARSEIMGNDFDFDFYKSNYFYNSNSFEYQTAYVQPIIREVFEEDGILYFTGWLNNSNEDLKADWNLVTFVIMGNFTDILNVDDLNLEISELSKLKEYKSFCILNENGSNSTGEYSLADVKSMLKIGTQIKVIYTVSNGFNKDNLKYNEICNETDEFQCISLYLNSIYKPNVGTVLDVFRNEDKVYVSVLSSNIIE